MVPVEEPEGESVHVREKLIAHVHDRTIPYPADQIPVAEIEEAAQQAQQRDQGGIRQNLP